MKKNMAPLFDDQQQTLHALGLRRPPKADSSQWQIERCAKVSKYDKQGVGSRVLGVGCRGKMEYWNIWG